MILEISEECNVLLNESGATVEQLLLMFNSMPHDYRHALESHHFLVHNFTATTMNRKARIELPNGMLVMFNTNLPYGIEIEMLVMLMLPIWRLHNDKQNRRT
ncbi:MAG: hypothetical protein DRG30_03490 [Epsilonproteobacteria bacterium]|nr:MAG: hypothetical protein DRG30_03490 [Campylobacterota bacterium]